MRKLHSPKRPGLFALPVFPASLGYGGTSYGALMNWTCGSDFWDTAACWQGVGFPAIPPRVPTSSDQVIVAISFNHS